MTPTQHSMVRSPHNSGLRIIGGLDRVQHCAATWHPCRSTNRMKRWCVSSVSRFTRSSKLSNRDHSFRQTLYSWNQIAQALAEKSRNRLLQLATTG